MAPYKTPVNADYSWPEPFNTPPLKIDSSMDGLMDPAYIAFFKEELVNRPDILETHKFPVAQTKAGGNKIPGQAPAEEMAKIYDIDIPRKYTDADAGTIKARIFVPKGTKPSNGWPCMIWYHGGGWVLGSIDTENNFCTQLAQGAQCTVITIDYRLAPEHPYPAAVEDSFEGLMYVMENSKNLDIDNTKVGVSGSSAGGNLSAIMCHKYASSPYSKDLPPLKIQFLVVPVCDNTATPQTYETWRKFEHTPQLPANKMYWYRQLYLPEGGETLTEPEASPLFYPDDSFKNVPQAFIAAAGCDVLSGEALAYHAKLIKNGVQSKINVYKGVPHTVMVMNAKLKQGVALTNDACSAVKQAMEE